MRYTGDRSTITPTAKKGKKMENEVTIVDVKMPFLSMVVFMVKFAIASIPAAIILMIIFGVLGAIFGGMFGVGQF
jgi:hypothetical protein